ncbi:citrate synthase [Euzebya tangerina]|uniref:citrate synthase n=1 Tax=Euzebya tangerina TaxID=591198 RepID=UPI000E30D1BB|nr:citrate synthase [Euzebya tangerina]
MTDHATIALNGESFDAPVVTGTEGERGIHSSGLRGATGLTTYDPGFASTASCQSEITYLNGEAGILRYRGYPIEQLAESSSFLETAYLLIYGDLPDQATLDDFEHQITIHTLLHEDMRQFFDAFPKSAHPMAILSAAVAGLSTFYQDHYDPLDERDVEVSIYRLMAKLPTIAAWSYKKSIGQRFIYPWNKLSYPENFLHMMFAVKAEPYEVDPEVAKALDLLYILHADHEQNASASAVRLVGSTQVNMFAAIASGINALWGPLHGGANQAVLEMLTEIRDADGDTASFIARAKDRDDPFRLMGFGHRVYKNFDPRATIIKETADRVLRKLIPNDPLFEIAQELEEVALKDDYFIEKKLYPNVDFYSGLIYRAMGLPEEMFTVMFAIGRLPGWIAQWKEMMADPETRIGRPRQIYQGSSERTYVPIESRG